MQTPAAAGPWMQTWLRQHLSLVDILVLNGSSGHLDQDGSGHNMTPGHQQGHKMPPRPQASGGLWPHHGDLGINLDLSCGRTTGIDMVLSSSLGLDFTRAPGDGKSHPDVRSQWQDHSRTRSWSQEAARPTEVSMALNGKRCQGYKHRPWLLSNQRPTYGLL